MDIQNIFYFLASVFIVLWIGITIFFAVIVWKTYIALKDAPAEIKAKLEELIPEKSHALMGIAGTIVTTFIINKVKNIFKRK